jgi:hypothetical protein
MHVCRARVRHATTRSPARLPRYESVSQLTAFSLNRIITTWMKATVVQSCFARRWSGYEMQLLAAKSSAFMSMPRIGSPAVTPIKCS